MIKNCIFCGKEVKSKSIYCSINCANKKKKIPRIEIRCLQCDKKFTVTKWLYEKSEKRYCSVECRGKSKRVPLIKKICPICNNTFLTDNWKIKTSKNNYCSNDCKRIGKRIAKIKKICPICKDEFTITKWHNDRSKNNYCSKECLVKAKVTGQTVPCEICGKERWVFNSNRSKHIYCSLECSANATRSEHYNPQARANYGKKWSRNVRKRDNYLCQKCGSGEKLHAHHILSWKDYPEERFNLDNGITLCMDCHIQHHKEQI